MLKIDVTARRFDVLKEELSINVLQACLLAKQCDVIALTSSPFPSTIIKKPMPCTSRSGPSSSTAEWGDSLQAILPLLGQAQSTLKAANVRLKLALRECRGALLQLRERLDIFVEANQASAEEFADEGLLCRASTKGWIAGIQRVLSNRLDYFVDGREGVDRKSRVCPLLQLAPQAAQTDAPEGGAP